MATISPFRALRYNPGRGCDVSAVTAPPYDVIGGALHKQLLAEPENIVHVDFNLGSTDPDEPGNRYEQAAATLAGWRLREILTQDEQPALYVYEQTYEWGSQTLVRRSFVARVRLEELGSGHIHPHEQTFSGPKEDRFQLTRATECVLSQHLGIYPDPEQAVFAILAPFTQCEPDLVATGCDGVVNRVWAVTEPTALEAVMAAMADRDVFIADGHHRYGMMLRYRDYVANGGELPADHPAQWTTFVLVGSGDTGLCVMPTHRVASGWPGVTAAQLTAAAGEAFTYTPLAVDPHDGEALDARLATAGIGDIGVLTREGAGLLTLRDASLLDRELADLAPALRELNVSVLHRLLLPAVEQALGTPTLAYVHRAGEAVDLLADGADAAFLLRATPLQSVLDVALAHELMPQKSTYFYPKVLTGLVMYPLT